MVAPVRNFEVYGNGIDVKMDESVNLKKFINLLIAKIEEFSTSDISSLKISLNLLEVSINDFNKPNPLCLETNQVLDCLIDTLQREIDNQLLEKVECNLISPQICRNIFKLIRDKKSQNEQNQINFVHDWTGTSNQFSERSIRI